MLDKQQVQRQFDRSASSYDGVAAMQRDIVDFLLSASDWSLPSADSLCTGGGTFLDAGCGTGYGLKQVAELLPQLSLKGVDIAPKMLEVAKKTCPSAELIVGDIESLPLASATQNFILSSSAIQWCDTSKVLEEFNRCLVPGGQLLLSTFTQGTLAQWRSLWGRNNEQSFVTANELGAVFKQSNWVNVRLSQREFVQTFTSFEDAVASIRDLGAGDASPARSTSPMTRSQLCVVKQRINSLIKQQGFIELKYQLAFVHATKSAVTA